MTISIYAPPDGIAVTPANPEFASYVDTLPNEVEAAIVRLANEYPEYAHRDIADMERYAEKMTNDHPNRAAHYNEILRIAHDVRGQGALFGYPLITRCAGSLCRATRLLAAHDRAILNIVQTHLAAMRAILETGVTGANDRTALAIAAGLEFLVNARTGR
ncbi:MAG: hypothetical protein OEY16_02630 [Alphaproteobacteria bacterium]|nr:hypothetical protein [Alphaproteobacteria bacterium]